MLLDQISILSILERGKRNEEEFVLRDDNHPLFGFGGQIFDDGGDQKLVELFEIATSWVGGVILTSRAAICADTIAGGNDQIFEGSFGRKFGLMKGNFSGGFDYPDQDSIVNG